MPAYNITAPTKHEGDPRVAFNAVQFKAKCLLFLAHVQHEIVIYQLVAVLQHDFLLTLFDFGIEELDDFARLHVDHMVVVAAVGQFKHCMTAVEVVTNDKTCRLELGQNTVNRGQTDVLACLHQRLVDVFSTHVALLGGVEHL